nr:structural protein [Sobelivirales sp.]
MDQRKKQNSVKTTQSPNQKSSSQKRRERRKANKLNTAAGPKQMVYPLPSYTNTGMRALSRIPKRKLTPGGLSFLKCAFAPPDFAASNPTGVPDDYQGPSLVKKHRYVGTFNCSVANRDYYILLCPMAGGIAYFSSSVAAGTPILANTDFMAVNFSDTPTLFPATNNAADIVTKYRFVSNHIELIPTMNQMSWSGSIQVWRAPIVMDDRPTSDASNEYSISGLQSCNATNANQYTGPTNLGVYAAAYNTGAKFDFQTIKEGINSVPTGITGADFGRLIGQGGTYPLCGIDPQFESVIIKISGMGATITNSFVLKVWSCVEYQPVVGSVVYEYQTLSPCDAYAMEMYRAIIAQLPIGVPFLENDGFWKRVLGIIKGISGPLSMIPGPYGAISSGVNSIASGIDSLLL